MAELTVGVKAPNFSLKDSVGKIYSLSQFTGKKIVIYFYPQDDTETCTKQACAFRDEYSEIQKAGAIVLGISPDDGISHEKFIRKYHLNFPILSDTDCSTMKAYGVWAKKKMFGRTYMGVLRTTYIVDESGIISHVFTNVRIKGHVEKIMKALKD